MNAVVFAAGFGTRLRPLTDIVPKALIEINGKTILQIILENLASVGVEHFIVNTHHLHEKIAKYLQANKNFGLDIHISHEKEYPLETGGTLKNNEVFLRRGGPFFACNADIISDINLKALYSWHCSSSSIATLAVRKRPSSRHLMFDNEMRLIGREGEISGDGLNAYGFSCVQVISPEIFDMITEKGVFSITNVYLRLSAKTKRIYGFNDGASYWFDIGSYDKLQAARKFFYGKEL